MFVHRWIVVGFCAIGAAAQAPVAQKYESLNAVVWTQASAEHSALVSQTYHVAEQALLRALGDKHWTAALEQNNRFEDLPPAVILDLDETVLDNSPFRAALVISSRSYTDQAWEQWVAEARASALPGAVTFLNKAALSGVSPIYITNRVCHPGNHDDPTWIVLQRLHIPVKAENLLCRSNPDDAEDKSARRALIARSHRILLMFGDDLTDFVPVSKEASTVGERAKLVHLYEHLWGDRWFLLPNPMYGSWERTIGLDLESKTHALRP